MTVNFYSACSMPWRHTRVRPCSIPWRHTRVTPVLVLIIFVIVYGTSLTGNLKDVLTLVITAVLTAAVEDLVRTAVLPSAAADDLVRTAVLPS